MTTEQGRPLLVRDDYRLPRAVNPLWDKQPRPGDPSSFAPAFWLIAAHGGAGVTTLAHIWEPAADAQRTWPVADENQLCVIVARSTRTGLDAAAQIALGIDPWCHLLGVAVVADAPGKLPKPLVHTLDVLRRHDTIPNVWSIEYNHQLRSTVTADLAQWRPGQACDQHRKPLPPTEAVPPNIAEVGASIFAVAQTYKKKISE